MASEVTIPRLGWAMEKGTFLEWRKLEGQTVREGEVLFVMEGDKAVQEVEALDSGVLHVGELGPRAGEEVVVGRVVAFILKPGELAPVSAAVVPSAPAAPPTPARTPSAAPSAATADTAATRLVAPHATNGQRPRVSPRARRVARELGIGTEGLRGSGTSGRVTEADVRAAHGASPAPAAAAGARSTLTVSVEAKVFEDFARRVRTVAPEVDPALLVTSLLVRLAGSAAASLLPAGETAVLAVARIGAAGTVYLVTDRAASSGVVEMARALSVEAAGASASARIPGGVTLAVMDATEMGFDNYTPASPTATPLLVIGARTSGFLTLSLHFGEDKLPLVAASRLLTRIREALESPSLWLAR